MPPIRIDAGADSAKAETVVFTFKEGLLSAMAHDLRLKVTRWNLAWDAAAQTLEASWDAGSLVVEAVMRDGREHPGALGQRDFDKIAKTVRDEVLSASRYAQIRFRATRLVADGPEAMKIEGELELHGAKRQVATRATLAGGRWSAEVVLNQPDYGIKPYSAMLGALKIKPEVKVRVSIAADAVKLSQGTA